MERVILHSDMNNFFASVECLYHPELRGKPVAVCGSIEDRHGIVLAKNREAKACGILTGEAIGAARGKCPALTVLKPHYEEYVRFSTLARRIYAEYTDVTEPFSIDESWLDVSAGCTGIAQGEALAEEIRKRIRFELGVTVSIGVSFNKIFAKLGSDLKKPDAVTVISPGDFRQKIWPLPARDLLFLGPATERTLYRHGIYTIGDVAAADPDCLRLWLGKMGGILRRYADGTDATPVCSAEETPPVKSVGSSTTLPRDLHTYEDAAAVSRALSENIAERLRKLGAIASLLQIGIRDASLRSFTRQVKLNRPTSTSGDLCRAAMELIQANWDLSFPIRSLGIRGAELLPESAAVQLSIYEDPERMLRREKIDRTMDEVRRRFGHESIGRAAALLDPELGLCLKCGGTAVPTGFSR